MERNVKLHRLLLALVGLTNLLPVVPTSGELSRECVDGDEWHSSGQRYLQCGPGNLYNLSEVPLQANESKSGVAEDIDACTLYLAESAIPNAGLGVFTGIDLEQGTTIGEPGLLIPLFDVADKKDAWSLWHDFVWNEDLADRIPFESSVNSDTFYPGVGAHINCHMGLNNVENGVPTLDSAGLHRSKDPGVGAFSTYHSMEMKTSKRVSAQSELFIDYGENWFVEREEVLGIVPFQRDFQKADRILRKLKEVSNNDNRDMVLDLVRNYADDRVRMALPGDARDIDHAIAVGTAYYSLPNFIRTPQWLKQNGICIDGLRPEKSKVPQAGRGAFSKRFVAKGSIIIGSPIVHVARDALPPYAVQHPSDEASAVREQVLLNYCFGHPKSSILLLPYSPIVNFINHRSREPNAEVRWSMSPSHHGEWLALSSEELLRRKNGLLVEFVALRDISPGEEVFIDYGPEWENAWASHVENWAPPENSESYSSASELDIKTKEEQMIDPYPDNIFTACYYVSHGWKSHAMELEVEWTSNNFGCLRPCEIISKENIDGEEYFMATMKNREKEDFDWCILSPYEAHTVTLIPRHAVTLLDREYTSDVHINNAFRHEMGVPPGFFPSAWMDA